MARPRSDIAPRILTAARQRFLEEGVAGASLRKIAEDAGTNIGMIYYYFPTKDDLFAAVLEEIYEGFLADFEAILDSEGPLDQRLRRLSTRIGEMSEPEFAVFRISVREALVSTDRLGKLADRFMRGHVPVILSALQKSVGAGELRRDIPFPMIVIAVAVLVAAPQIVRRRALANVPGLARVLPGPADLARHMVGILFHGVAN